MMQEAALLHLSRVMLVECAEPRAATHLGIVKNNKSAMEAGGRSPLLVIWRAAWPTFDGERS